MKKFIVCIMLTTITSTDNLHASFGPKKPTTDKRQPLTPEQRREQGNQNLRKIVPLVNFHRSSTPTERLRQTGNVPTHPQNYNYSQLRKSFFAGAMSATTILLALQRLPTSTNLFTNISNLVQMALARISHSSQS